MLGRGAVIPNQGVSDEGTSRAELIFGFAQGSIPTVSTIKRQLSDCSGLYINTISDGEHGESVLGIQFGSLTFDLVYPSASQHVGVDKHTDDRILLKLGPHLVGGEAMMPIVKGWMECARIVSDSLGSLESVIWSPAGHSVRPDLFSATIDNWSSHGRWPVPVLVAIERIGGDGLRSKGLSHFIGQELVLERSSAPEQVNAERLLGVIASHLALSGTLLDSQSLKGPDGANLVIEPIEGGTLVRAFRG